MGGATCKDPSFRSLKSGFESCFGFCNLSPPCVCSQIAKLTDIEAPGRTVTVFTVGTEIRLLRTGVGPSVRGVLLPSVAAGPTPCPSGSGVHIQISNSVTIATSPTDKVQPAEGFEPSVYRLRSGCLATWPYRRCRVHGIIL